MVHDLQVNTSSWPSAPSPHKKDPLMVRESHINSRLPWHILMSPAKIQLASFELAISTTLALSRSAADY
ncbi:hypothetical protein N7490_009407 [Penicillium lividum]|nr:hypothetical protein N7490_009407 [Penicillium lividum]